MVPTNMFIEEIIQAGMLLVSGVGCHCETSNPSYVTGGERTSGAEELAGTGEVAENQRASCPNRLDRTLELSRPRDYCRILCSNPAIIEPWFSLVHSQCESQAKYGILDENTCNFDETGFHIGVGGSVKVVTASELRLNPIRR